MEKGKSQKKENPNPGEEKKIECWNCGGNHFQRDCKKPRKEKDGKVNVTIGKDDEDDLPGIILTCYERNPKESLENEIQELEESDNEETLNDLPDEESEDDPLAE